MADAGSKTIVDKKAEAADSEQDLYIRMKELESELAMLQIQENYLKDEQRHLKSEYVRSKEEVSPSRCHNPCQEASHTSQQSVDSSLPCTDSLASFETFRPSATIELSFCCRF